MSKTKQAILLIGDESTCPDIQWLSGFRAVDPIVLFLQNGRCHLVVPEMELTRAKQEAGRCRVHTPRTLGFNSKKAVGQTEWALGLLKEMNCKSVIVPASFPAGIYETLRRKKIRVSVSRENLFSARAVKKAHEVDNIRHAQKAAVNACRDAIAMIRDAGVNKAGELTLDGAVLTSERVKSQINRSLLEEQCFCETVIVAGGEQAVEPHNFGSGPLRAHEAIVLDIFPRSLETGYWGDLTRTVVKGKPSPELRKLYKTVKASQEMALSKVRSGVEAASIHEAVCRFFEEAGYESGVVNGEPVGFCHGTGHGVGLQIHEAPGVGRRPGKLRAGHVITIEPGLYYPGLGGVRVEDTVLVTRNGFEHLARCSKSFVLS